MLKFPQGLDEKSSHKIELIQPTSDDTRETFEFEFRGRQQILCTLYSFLGILTKLFRMCKMCMDFIYIFPNMSSCVFGVNNERADAYERLFVILLHFTKQCR